MGEELITRSGVKQTFSTTITAFFNNNNCYTPSSIATPARIHFDGFCLVLRLNVHTYVGPLCLILYTGHSYMFRKSCLSLIMAFTCITGITGNSSFNIESTMHPDVTSQRAPSNINPFIMAPSLGANLNNHETIVSFIL